MNLKVSGHMYPGSGLQTEIECSDSGLPPYLIILRQFRLEVLMLFLGIFFVYCWCSFFYWVFLYHGISFSWKCWCSFGNIPINFWLMLFLLTLMVPWYKAMNMLINCLVCLYKKSPKFIFSQNQSHQPQFVGQSLDTCIHQPPRSPHMKQSLVHKCMVSSKVGQNTMF